MELFLLPGIESSKPFDMVCDLQDGSEDATEKVTFVWELLIDSRSVLVSCSPINSFDVGKLLTEERAGEKSSIMLIVSPSTMHFNACSTCHGSKKMTFRGSFSWEFWTLD